MKISSPAFANDGPIPSKYTCDGENISPAIEWSDVPDGTKTLALICDDPDAPRGVFVHWVVFNLPASVTGLPEGVPPDGTLNGGGHQGVNDFGKVGYGGPCPPSGTHHYRFTLYAVDTELGVRKTPTRRDVDDAMKGHVIESVRLTGTYARTRSR